MMVLLLAHRKIVNNRAVNIHTVYTVTVKCSENLVLGAVKLNFKLNEFTKTDHQLGLCCEF